MFADEIGFLIICMKERLHAMVEGKVQGVGYRLFVLRRAQQYDLTGWVMNLSDGKVEVTAEGEREKLDLFLDLIRTGPPMSSVRRIEFEWLKATREFDGFEITA
jgi:acylphosphatase